MPAADLFTAFDEKHGDNMLKTLAYAHEAMPMTSILRTCFKKRKLEGEAKEGVDLPEELVPHRVHAKELNSGRMRSWEEKLGATGMETYGAAKWI